MNTRTQKTIQELLKKGYSVFVEIRQTCIGKLIWCVTVRSKEGFSEQQYGNGTGETLYQAIKSAEKLLKPIQ